MGNKLFLSCLVLFYCAIDGDGEEIKTIEVDINGKSVEREVIKVLFENQSGETVELWSDTPESVFFKASLKDKEKVTIDCYIDEKIYFTPKNSGGSHEHQKYATFIRKVDEKEGITLYDKKKMNDYIKRKDVGCDRSNDGRCDIIFINKSGKKLKIFWDDGKVGMYQGILSINDEMTMHTHVGHSFFCTSLHANDDDKNKKRLFTHKVTPKSKVVLIENID